ncbi:hypothetical protein QNI14_04610, partial [Microbacterium sp. LX3-4]|nr:hypothetical protein [Microbacterium sp. LX3-4]
MHPTSKAPESERPLRKIALALLISVALLFTSAPYAAVAAAKFTSAPVPTVSGSAKVGSTLTVAAGQWKPAASLSYQWKRGSASISGATGSTYK